MNRSFFASLFALVCIASPLMGQGNPHLALSNSPAYEAAAYALRNAPPRQYSFSKAVLSDVMRLMAEDAGIGFFGLPEGNTSATNLVTFTINAAPFSALETLAKANGVTLIYDSGIWYLRPANDQELIGRIYEINYNAQELVTKNTQSAMGSGGNSSSQNGQSASSGLNLQGAPDFFVVEPSRILEDIQNILNIPTTGNVASLAPTASVDNMGRFSMGGFQGQPDLSVPVAMNQGNFAQVVEPNSGQGGGNQTSGQSKVIWNSDSNTLYVVATRQQHQWIEAYLASADRPQPMIAVEVKFVETSRDPNSELGIDWNGVLGQEGLNVSLSNNEGPLNLNRVSGYALPTAVLSYSDLNLKLRAIYNDRKTRMVSYPRMVTLDNREVSFRSVINQPVLSSDASASLGAGATQVSSVEYLPIGTVINVLPKLMAGNKVLLNVSVTVSDIVGTEIINGNPFPIATSRVYTAPLTVQSGYTVAISGLDAARSDENESGLPILGRIPVIGYAFKHRSLGRKRQHLMMLITPVALNSGREGLTEKPITREPWKAAPIHVPIQSGKTVIADRGERASVRAEPVADVPDFNEAASTRKSNRTFGKDTEDSTTPIPVTITERSTASRVTYPAPPAPAHSGSSLGAIAPAYAGATPKSVPSKTAEPVTAPRPDREAPNAPVSPKSQVTVSELPVEKTENVAPATEVKPKDDGEGQSANPVGNNDSQGKPATEKTGESDTGKGAASAEKDDPRVSEIRTKIKKLKSDLNKIPDGDGKLSVDDAQLVVNVHESAQELLGEIDQARGDKSKPLAGNLGDAWWDLINLKSTTAKLSRRSPESLALAGQKKDSESEGETTPKSEAAPQP